MGSADDVARETHLLVSARADPTAFGELFRSLWPVLVRRLVRQTWCAEVAADIASETFARAVMKCAQFDSTRGSARTWLWSIAQNELRTWMRRGVVESRARRKIGFCPTASNELLDELLDAAVAHEWHEALRNALASLTAESRRVVGLRVLDEWSYKEIAHELGCTEGAARVRFSRAIAALRGVLSEPPIDAVWS